MNAFNFKGMNWKDNLVGGLSGLAGGGYKFIIDINANPSFHQYFISLVGAGFTALVCGFLGVLGKHLFVKSKDFLVKKFKPTKDANK